MNSPCGAVMRYLNSGIPLVLITMMDRKGSAPRTAGARMLVLPDGSALGTVGGGRCEAEAIDAALALHRTGAVREKAVPGMVLEYSLRGATDMDMICGGALLLLLEYLPADDARVRAAFSLGRKEERATRAFSFVTCVSSLEDGNSDFPHDGRCADTEFPHLRRGVPIMVERFALSGLRDVPSPCGNGMEFLMEPPGFVPGAVLRRAATLVECVPRLVSESGRNWLLEHFPKPFRVVLFGGGHVSLETARLAQSVDFHVTVVDDRPEFANAERFPGALIQVPASLGEKDSVTLLSHLGIGPQDALVILTRGHAWDREVLAAALRTEAGYVGMIGSSSKRAAVYEALQARGAPKERLDSVHSPVGLPIGAESPAEIAVSIVGELIRWRSAAQRAARA